MNSAKEDIRLVDGCYPYCAEDSVRNEGFSLEYILVPQFRWQTVTALYGRERQILVLELGTQHKQEGGNNVSAFSKDISCMKSAAVCENDSIIPI